MKTKLFFDRSIQHEDRIQASLALQMTTPQRSASCSRGSIQEPPFAQALAWVAIVLLVGASSVSAQVNSGSNGSDGVLNPTSNLVIDMADHPDGIYQYESVNIRSGVTVTFIPNAANTPVVWLVQDSVTIVGVVDVRGKGSSQNVSTPVLGGPGGYGSGAGGSSQFPPGPGLGPGGGLVTSGQLDWQGGTGSYSTKGEENQTSHPSGEIYGNKFLVPLIGGSGGSGGYRVRSGQISSTVARSAGGGGGGAILIAANNRVQISGSVRADGGVAGLGGGGGSGGAIRIVSNEISGNGSLSASGSSDGSISAGDGRIRLDAQIDVFGGSFGVRDLEASVSRGFQPIILPPVTQLPQLNITSIGSTSVASPPGGLLGSPDAVISGAQSNPISVVVKCSNIPMNSEIFLQIRPTAGNVTVASGRNALGDLALSTAVIPVSFPRGAGTIQAKAVSGIVNQFASNAQARENVSIAHTGWLATGERFKAVEVTSTLGGGQSLVYISDSGQRYSLGN